MTAATRYGIYELRLEPDNNGALQWTGETSPTGTVVEAASAWDALNQLLHEAPIGSSIKSERSRYDKQLGVHVRALGPEAEAVLVLGGGRCSPSARRYVAIPMEEGQP